jgi:hypothetical protein
VIERSRAGQDKLPAGESLLHCRQDSRSNVFDRDEAGLAIARGKKDGLLS